MTIVLVALLTLLSTLLVSNHSKEQELLTLRTDYQTEHAEVNRLTGENTRLLEDIAKKPNAVAETVKEVYKEICTGAVAEERILNAPPTVKRDVKNESQQATKVYADIDAPFDPEFIKLLE
jgi:hypothetical protein